MYVFNELLVLKNLTNMFFKTFVPNTFNDQNLVKD